MATALDSYMPYDSGPGAAVTEDGWRQFAKNFRGDGVIRTIGGEFRPFGDSTGMQVKVPTGECWIRGQWGNSTAQKTIPIATAHATLQRLDLVVLRNDFVNNQIVIDVLQGVAGSGTFPVLTQNTSIWEIQLAQVTVAAAAVTISAGACRAIPDYTDGSCSYTVDSSFQSVSSGGSGARVDYDIEQFPSSVVGRPSIREWKLNRAGMWMIVANVYWDNPSSTGFRQVWIQRQFSGGSANPSKLALSTVNAVSGAGTAQNITAMDRFTSGEIVEVWCFQNSGVSINILGTSSFNEGTRVELYWLGP
jgi:hypothetical protein